MATVQTQAQDYRTVGVSLSSSSKTVIYSVGTDGEREIDITGITIADSTGAVNAGATVHVTLRTGDSERVLAMPKADEIDNSWHVEGTPVRLGPGGSIAVTGANGHHVFVSFNKIVRTGADAQK